MATIKKAPSQPELRYHRSLVIGATGQIGSHVVAELVEREISVRCLRRWNSDTERLTGLDVEQIVGDVLDFDSLIGAMSGCNYVFYAVAPAVGLSTREILLESVGAIRTVIEAAREVGVDRIVVTSSAATLAAEGSQARLVSEKDVYLPGTSADAFVEAKYAVEQECARYSADGADIVLLNPGLCVGPGVDLRPYLALGVEDDARVNFVDIRDVARAHVDALSLGRPGARYALGGVNGYVGDLLADWRVGRAARVEQLLPQWVQKQRRRISGMSGGISAVVGGLRQETAGVVREAGLVREGRWLDTRLAEQELGWRSRL